MKILFLFINQIFLNEDAFPRLMKRIQHCATDNRYTLKDTCPDCGKVTQTTQPPKYSVDDKYSGYRREAKKAARQEAGHL